MGWWEGGERSRHPCEGEPMGPLVAAVGGRL